MNTILLILGGICIIIGFVLLTITKPTTEATVTDVMSTCRVPLRHNFCMVSVKYNVNGKDYNRALNKKRYFGKVGDKLKIEYSASNPSHISSNNSSKILGILLIIVGVFMCGLSYMNVL